MRKSTNSNSWSKINTLISSPPDIRHANPSRQCNVALPSLTRQAVSPCAASQTLEALIQPVFYICITHGAKLMVTSLAKTFGEEQLTIQAIYKQDADFGDQFKIINSRDLMDASISVNIDFPLSFDQLKTLCEEVEALYSKKPLRALCVDPNIGDIGSDEPTELFYQLNEVMKPDFTFGFSATPTCVDKTNRYLRRELPRKPSPHTIGEASDRKGLTEIIPRIIRAASPLMPLTALDEIDACRDMCTAVEEIDSDSIILNVDHNSRP